jgi:hypothetical protein
MPKIFIAFSFRNEDRALANQIDRLLASHSVRSVNGERLGGEEVTPEVKKLIGECDGLVALLTKRDKVAKKNIWRTHEWVKYELDHARDNRVPAIALVEKGVELGGPYTANERIDLDPQNPLEAFIRLSETIGQWKLKLGRTIKVRILPPTLAQKAGEGGETIKCRQRYFIGGVPSDWKDITPVPEPGGTFVYLQGVSDDHTIQLEVEEEKRVKWLSVASPQWVAIELSRKGARK